MVNIYHNQINLIKKNIYSQIHFVNLVIKKKDLVEGPKLFGAFNQIYFVLTNINKINFVSESKLVSYNQIYLDNR